MEYILILRKHFKDSGLLKNDVSFFFFFQHFKICQNPHCKFIPGSSDHINKKLLIQKEKIKTFGGCWSL